MLVIGVTGGIGSGKSTVVDRFAELGASVISGDQISRELVRPGQPALAEIVARFGTSILTDAGELDRAALAEVVFSDAEALADLNDIMDERIQDEIVRRLHSLSDDAVAVIESPLLVERGRTDSVDVVVVVLADEDLRAQRVASNRGLTQEDVRNRMRHQASDVQRREVADVVIENNAGLDELTAATDAVWHRLVSA